MIKLSPQERYKSFNDISTDISKGVIGEIDFTEEEKEVYRNFAEVLIKHIVKLNSRYERIKEINLVLSRLSTLIRNSSLETFIQDNRSLIDCFIEGSYTFYPNANIQVSTIIDFYKLLQRLEPYQQKIVLDNIDMRLSKIEKETEIDDLPF